MLAAVMPLPNDEVTPPVTKTYLATDFLVLWLVWQMLPNRGGQREPRRPARARAASWAEPRRPARARVASWAEPRRPARAASGFLGRAPAPGVMVVGGRGISATVATEPLRHRSGCPDVSGSRRA